MIDRPDATVLLEAMAATLTDKVMPELSGGAQHQARIVANLGQILENAGAGRGLISVCTAGGMGVAAIMERP